MRGRPPCVQARMRLTCGVNGASDIRDGVAQTARGASRMRGNAACTARGAPCAVRHVPCAARAVFLHYARCVRRFCTMRATVSAKPTATSAAVTT